MRQIDHRVEADRAGRTLERVRDAHHLGQRLGRRPRRAAREHARRHRLERVVRLGAEQLAQHRELVGIEVEIGVAHDRPCGPLAALRLDAARARAGSGASGSSSVSGRPVASTTAPPVSRSDAT